MAVNEFAVCASGMRPLAVYSELSNIPSNFCPKWPGWVQVAREWRLEDSLFRPSTTTAIRRIAESLKAGWDAHQDSNLRPFDSCPSPCSPWGLPSWKATSRRGGRGWFCCRRCSGRGLWWTGPAGGDRLPREYQFRSYAAVLQACRVALLLVDCRRGHMVHLDFLNRQFPLESNEA